jgi:hypothetical protein
MMKLTFTLMPLCLISQESTKKLMILVIEVEQSKSVGFSWEAHRNGWRLASCYGNSIFKSELAVP